jgi:hypothetical protein
MYELNEITEKIKSLVAARDILQDEYTKSEFHRKKEENPDTTVPSEPEDKEIYKLLTAIQQLELFIKKFQDIQLDLIKKHDE